VLAALGEPNLMWSAVDAGGSTASAAAAFGGDVVSGGVLLVLLPVGSALSAG